MILLYWTTLFGIDQRTYFFMFDCFKTLCLQKTKKSVSHNIFRITLKQKVDAFIERHFGLLRNFKTKK